MCMAAHIVIHNKPSGIVTTGNTIVLTGSNFKTNGTVSIYFNGVLTGTAPTDGSGSFTYTLTIPVKRDYGTRATITTNDGNDHVYNQEIIVPN